MIELLSKLESDKDKWIYQALEVFVHDFQRSELLENLDTNQSAENQILQIKAMGESVRRQKSQELKDMNQTIQQLRKTIDQDEESCEDSEKAMADLRGDLTSLTDKLQLLDQLKMVQFDYQLEEHFTFEKGKVIFKDRKTDKLVETFRSLELEMLQHYEKQMRESVTAMKTILIESETNPNLDFETTPSISFLELRHKGLSNQYLLYKNFEEDFSIVEETLDENHETIRQYYQLQKNQMMKQGKQTLNDVWEAKQSDYKVAKEEVEEKKQRIQINQEQLKELQEQLDNTIREWNQVVEYLQKLDDVLKEEFVQAVTALQTQLFSPDMSDSEKWAYHQYSQIMLKQAERIIGNDDI